MDQELIKDGEIRSHENFWYATYEFDHPLSDDQEKVAKTALLYRLMEFLENSQYSQFSFKIVVRKQFAQIPDFLGRRHMHKPSIAIVIYTKEKDE